MAGRASFLRKMAEAYVVAALWASTGDDGEPLDDTYSARDVALSTKRRVLRECGSFLRMAAESDDDRAMNATEMGHNFFLTRNGHGTGFWDRGIGAAGSRLSKIAKSFGSDDWYVGDDGKVYGSD